MPVTLLLIGLSSLAQQVDTRAATSVPISKVRCEVVHDSVEYEMRVEPRLQRTDLVVTARFSSGDESTMIVGLPDDREFGTRGLSRYVTEMVGLGGTIVEPGGDGTERRVRAGPGDTIELQYRLSFPPDAFGSATYAPSTGSRHVYVSGSQWLLRLGDPAQTRSFLIRMVDLPTGWQAFSSLGPDPARMESIESYEGLERQGFGAVGHGSTHFEAHGGPVDVHVAADFEIPETLIVNAVRRTVEYQRALFDDSSPFFHVAVLPRPGNVAGIAIPNLFTLFVKPDISLMQLSVLLSHEMLHTWMNYDVGHEDEPAESFVQNQWLIEGVTDYAARRMLLDSEVLSQDEFAQLVNRDFINLADNPHKAETFSEVMEAANAGRFGTSYAKLSYYRGAAMALNWEAQLRAAGSGVTVTDLVRELFRAFGSRDGYVGYEELYAFFAGYGLDVEADVERYILRGEPILPDPSALGDAFELVETSISSFDPGFSMSGSMRDGIVKGVRDGSAAHQAGLRNGMEILGIENGNRFANVWDPLRPLTVRIRMKGAVKEISFFPHGPERRLELFHSKAGQLDAPERTSLEA